MRFSERRIWAGFARNRLARFFETIDCADISRRHVDDVESGVLNSENVLNDDKENRCEFADEMFVVDLLSSKESDCSKAERTLVFIEIDSVSYDFLLTRLLESIFFLFFEKKFEISVLHHAVGPNRV